LGKGAVPTHLSAMPLKKKGPSTERRGRLVIEKRGKGVTTSSGIASYFATSGPTVEGLLERGEKDEGKQGRGTGETARRRNTTRETVMTYNSKYEKIRRAYRVQKERRSGILKVLVTAGEVRRPGREDLWNKCRG